MTQKQEDVKAWAAQCLKEDCNYFIVVHDTSKNEFFPVYCKDFQVMHENAHKYSEMDTHKTITVVRVGNDGTYEENIQLHNLL